MGKVRNAAEGRHEETNRITQGWKATVKKKVSEPQAAGAA